MNISSLFIHELNQKTRMLTKEMNERLAQHGLYHSQWSILFCLKQYGSMTQTDIWRYLNVEAPTVTRTLTRLEKSGWIFRTQGNDKREKLVELTEKAKRMLPQVELTVRQFEQDMTERLSEEQQQFMLQLLQMLGTKKNRVIEEE